MEDSATRRERLQAMSLEAEAASSQSIDSSSSLPSSLPSLPSLQLSNPLLYPPPVAESSPSTPRFDYYTDPISAFSRANRRGGPGAYCSPTPPLSRPNLGQWNHHMSPAHPLHTTQSPGSTSYEMQSQFSQSALWRSPIKYSAPYAGCQGTPVSGSSQFLQNTCWRSPIQYSAPYAGCQGTPVSGSSLSSRPGSSSCYSNPSTPRSGGFSPHHGRGGSRLSNPARRGGPHPNSGPGKGGRFSSNCSPRRTGGQGHGFHHNGSGRQDTEHYYRKSMVEDPWSELKPVVGDITKPRYWPLKPKKAKVGESGNEYYFSKTGCLAQLLAESFEEAVTET